MRIPGRKGDERCWLRDRDRSAAIAIAPTPGEAQSGDAAPTVRRPTGRDGTGVEVSAVQRLEGQPPDRGHGCKRKVSRRIAELADVVAAPAICLPCCRETAGMEETVGDFPEAESTIHGRGAGTGGLGGVAESAV